MNAERPGPGSLCDVMLALGAGSNGYQQSFHFPLKDALLVGKKGRNYIGRCSPPTSLLAQKGAPCPPLARLCLGLVTILLQWGHGTNRTCVTQDSMISQKGGR